MAFVYWCFFQSSNKIGCKVPIVKTALVADLYRWAKKNGKLVSGKLKPGDMFMVRGGPNGHCHVGFVRRVISTSYVETIEGNTSANGSREGIAVMNHQRGVGSLDFCRVS
jgi:hypothetical protein